MLKTDLLTPGEALTSLKEARLAAASFLSTSCHLDRRHAALGYRSAPHVAVNLLK